MRAVLVFCEGITDVVFVERSLGALGDYERLQIPIRDLPSPFGADKSLKKGLIAKRLADQNFEDYSLENPYVPSPHFQSVVQCVGKDLIFLLVRMGGKTQIEAALELIKHVDTLISADEFKVVEHASVFLFDADAEGVDKTLAGFCAAYRGYFDDLTSAEHGTWITTDKFPIGVYIFHRDGQETGTLEDHLEPMVRSAWPDRYANAQQFIDGHRKQKDKVSYNEVRRLKAIMTAAGQFSLPGRPLSAVVARNGLPKEQFERSTTSQSLVRFLEATPWNSRPEASDAA